MYHVYVCTFLSSVCVLCVCVCVCVCVILAAIFGATVVEAQLSVRTMLRLNHCLSVPGRTRTCTCSCLPVINVLCLSIALCRCTYKIHGLQYQDNVSCIQM